MIRLRIDVPDAAKAEAEFAFRMLAMHWGVPIRIVDQSDDSAYDMLYAPAATACVSGALHIIFDAQAYDARVSFVLRELDGHPVWVPDTYQAADRVDHVGSVYRLLALLDEFGVEASARDRRGVFSVDALPVERMRARQLPLVDIHAQQLLDIVKANIPHTVGQLVPRWPHGKRFALALTHDTDAVTMSSFPELATNLAKLVARRDPIHWHMLRLGIQYVGKPLASNPFFGFGRWRDLGNTLGIKSCFYLFVLPGGFARDINDCKSTVMHHETDWKVLRDMARGGWEFGLHTPIRAKDQTDVLRVAKEWIESRIETPVIGMRHHYWSLDWHRPDRTFGAHMRAGFHYDTSIGWRDSVGFRAGTALPYAPFDLDARKVMEFVQLPTCLMDGHVMWSASSNDESTDRALSIVDAVREVGGVAVIDWHTETASNVYRHSGYFTVIERVLCTVLERGDVWVATPAELVSYWRKRAMALELL
jgi:hypothetical protein